MLRKAFCGNGFIHLNIAEIHEENIGARKGELRLAIRAQNDRILLRVTSTNLILLKCSLETLGRARTLHDNQTLATEPLLRYWSPQSSMMSRWSHRAENYGTRRIVG